MKYSFNIFTISFLFIYLFITMTPAYAAKKYLLDGEWVLNKQTNCEDPILQSLLKK